MSSREVGLGLGERREEGGRRRDEKLIDFGFGSEGSESTAVVSSTWSHTMEGRISFTTRFVFALNAHPSSLVLLPL